MHHTRSAVNGIRKCLLPPSTRKNVTPAELLCERQAISGGTGLDRF
jgi:hypothetical protein